jgi:translation initiation factor 2B subunit (eIF-2B alpha/beta/delta family)
MSENERGLLVIFEDCVHDLIKLCNERKRRIEELETSLKEKDEKIQQAERMMTTLKADYANLLIARRLADDKDAFQQARKRVSKLVREVDLCIALLNE